VCVGNNCDVTFQIPPSDLFEIGELPDLCPNLDNCLDLQSEGTYITVIKRKVSTHLKYIYFGSRVL
jgi:hypothetical protein